MEGEMHSIGSKLSTQQNMTSATGKIMDSIARTCSSLNTGFIFFMLFAINLSSLSPVSYAAPVRKYRYLKFRPEALELYPIDCRLMPRAKLCRGVMAKRSIPDQVMNEGSIAQDNLFKELYASNSDITLPSTTQNPIKNQLFGLADTRMHTQNPVLMDSMKPWARSNSILARRMLKLESTLLTAKIVENSLGS